MSIPHQKHPMHSVNSSTMHVLYLSAQTPSSFMVGGSSSHTLPVNINEQTVVESCHTQIIIGVMPGPINA